MDLLRRGRQAVQQPAILNLQTEPIHLYGKCYWTNQLPPYLLYRAITTVYLFGSLCLRYISLAKYKGLPSPLLLTNWNYTIIVIYYVLGLIQTLQAYILQKQGLNFTSGWPHTISYYSSAYPNYQTKALKNSEKMPAKVTDCLPTGTQNTNNAPLPVHVQLGSDPPKDTKAQPEAKRTPDNNPTINEDPQEVYIDCQESRPRSKSVSIDANMSAAPSGFVSRGARNRSHTGSKQMRRFQFEELKRHLEEKKASHGINSRHPPASLVVQNLIKSRDGSITDHMPWYAWLHGLLYNITAPTTIILSALFMTTTRTFNTYSEIQTYALNAAFLLIDFCVASIPISVCQCVYPMGMSVVWISIISIYWASGARVDPSPQPFLYHESVNWGLVWHLGYLVLLLLCFPLVHAVLYGLYRVKQQIKGPKAIHRQAVTSPFQWQISSRFNASTTLTRC